MKGFKKENPFKDVVTRTVVQDFNIDYKLLYAILEKQSPTHDESAQKQKANFLLKLIEKECGVKGTKDKHGNLYFVKGKAEFYPTTVAHYDTAQDFHPGFSIQKHGDWLYGFDTQNIAQCGLGADDGVGVYFAIEMLKRLPACKVALFYGEERGCIGSSKADTSFFDNSSIVSQLDRNSYENDFVVFTNNVQVFPENHFDKIQDIVTKYNYNFTKGVYTDVGALRKAGITVASHNTSCGYFNEHYNEEVIHIPSMINSMSMTYEIHQRLLETGMQLDHPKETMEDLFENNLNLSNKGYTELFEEGFRDCFNWFVSSGTKTEEEVRFIFNIPDDVKITKANINKGLIPAAAYAAHKGVGYNTLTKEEFKVDPDDVRDMFKHQQIMFEINPCCDVHYRHHVEQNVISCEQCGTAFFHDYSAEDVLNFDDDNCLSLNSIMNVVSNSL